MKIGDYVSASQIISGTTRQGVFVERIDKDSIRVQGELAEYICQPVATVVPDKNLFGETLEFVQKLRKTL